MLPEELNTKFVQPWTVWLFVAFILYYSIGYFNRKRHILRGSKIAKVAASTLDALRWAKPLEYPGRSHKWGAVSITKATRKPVLCVECTDEIKPYLGAFVVRRCMYCGIAAHDGCLKHVKDTCRPVSTPTSCQPHFWIVAGTTYNDVDDLRLQSTSLDGSSKCIYCMEEVKGGYFAEEPLWTCAHCQACAHVRCYVLGHPRLKHLEKCYLDSIEDQLSQNHSFISRHSKTKSMESLSNMSGWSGSLGSALTSDSEVANTLDECDMSTLRFVALPTIAVRKSGPKLPTNNISSQKFRRDSSPVKPSNMYHRLNEKSPSKKGRNSKKRQKSWWRRVFASQSLDWSRWEIRNSLIPDCCTPLLIFINEKSGPQIGKKLRSDFSRVLNPLQVVILPRNDPKDALKAFWKVSGLRLVCVGGDGTIGWIVSCIDEINRDFQGSEVRENHPPIAVLPVGTGNDMARCLGWGTGYSSWKTKGILKALNEVRNARIRKVDRWELQFQSVHPGKDGFVDRALHIITPRSISKLDERSRHMNNYFGVGVDAKVALEFHGARETHPEWFQSQFGNKLMYTGMGALDVVGAIGKQLDLSSKLTLICDEREIELPDGCQGIVVVNISSYMGGIDIWEKSEGRMEKKESSMSDGKLEVVAVYGSFHLGKLTVGLSRSVRLAQAYHIQIITTAKIPMQIDGEPFMHDQCMIHIRWSSQTNMLSSC